MSSRPLIAPLSALAQAEVARALPRSPGEGVLHRLVDVDGGRRLAVCAVAWAGTAEAETAFDAIVSRRAEARADRLLPVVSAGCHGPWHWVAYECGAALPLAAEGWRQWDAQAALGVVTDLAGTLDALAADVLVPYELGPASIFLDPRLGPLIGDLGTAREAFGDAAAGGHGAGFVPPELAAGAPVDARASVYAAGAILYSMLAGERPRPQPVTRRRPDLPDGIDLVLARALARDSLERYATVAELCESARRALGAAALVEPPAWAEPEPRRDPEPLADSPQEEPPPRVAPEPPREQAPREDVPTGDWVPLDPIPQAVALPPWEEADPNWTPPEPRWMRPLRALFLIAVLAAGALAGLQLTATDEPEGDAGAELTGDGIGITLPRGWEPGIPRGRVLLAAYPSTAWLSGLTARIDPGPIAAEDRTDPVRLGSFDAWRDTSEAPDVVRYRAPTSGGTLLLVCEASGPSATRTLALCERAVSTLELERPALLPLPGVLERPGLRAAVSRLSRDRAARRRDLARARTPGGQRTAAAALARSHTRAARRFERMPGGDLLAEAARASARAYTALSRAAGRSGTRWDTAREAVRRADGALARTVRAES